MNLFDGLFPTNKVYYNREDVLADKNNKFVHEDNENQNEESYFENDKTKLLGNK
jgi:hypothetical protein